MPVNLTKGYMFVGLINDIPVGHTAVPVELDVIEELASCVPCAEGDWQHGSGPCPSEQFLRTLSRNGLAEASVISTDGQEIMIEGMVAVRIPTPVAPVSLAEWVAAYH